MRILIALTYYRPHYSGLTIHAEREARALVERGHQVTVLTSRFDPHLPFREVRDGVEIVRPKVWFHISKGVIMPSMPYWAWKLARKSDVVHLHVPQLDAAPIALLARLSGKPVVLTYHCDLKLPAGLTHTLANLASNIANQVTARCANIVVHNTRDYAENSPFLRKYLDKLFPILPPVEVHQVGEPDYLSFRQKYDISPDQRLIGMAARLATEKGVEYLVEALPLVLEKHSQARVLFVGPYQNVVGEEEYARRLKPLLEQVEHHWTFLGIVSPAEMAAFFHECEVTVLPSINSTESYGLVQVESMACGTPVIATDLPGVRIPISQTGCGLIVPPMNFAALAEALIKILNEPRLFTGDPGEFIWQSTPAAVAVEYEKAFIAARENLKQKISQVQAAEENEPSY